MLILGLAFMVSLKFFIGILAFKFQDSGFFMHVQGNIVSFAAGSLFPLSLLPAAARTALGVLPFGYVNYTPAMLISGQMTFSQGLPGLGVLAAWTLAMFAVSQRAYQRLRVRYDGVGI